MMGPDEDWRVVARHGGYEVSRVGRVRNRRTGHVLKPVPHSKGYRKVNLGRKVHVYVHQLVCEAFAGPGPFGFEVDHEDFDRANNRASNLRWMPGTHNAARHERYAVGEPEEHEPLSAEELARFEEQLGAVSGW